MERTRRYPLAWLLIFGVVLALDWSTTTLSQTRPQAGISESSADVTQTLRQLPDGQRWIQHLNDDLLPFWTMKEALGDPEGNFPTYRCNDGSLYNPAKPCVELSDPDPMIKSIIHLDRDYVRMKARQVFAYGVAYHMTGEAKYLKIAREGYDFLRQKALRWDGSGSAGACSYFSGPQNDCKPERLERTSQDLAYAATGIAFYYYLTRDPLVLSELEALKEYIFRTYYDLARDSMAWVKQASRDNDNPDPGDNPDQIELVAQLDQVYAYMIWTAPTLPSRERILWKEDLRHLARIMVDQFYSPRTGLLWGSVTDVAHRKLGTDHMDFGHSVKAMWMIYEIGKLTGDVALEDFGRTHASKILELAYIPETGSWARRFNADGTVDQDKEWWILCELDEVAGTLALIDPAYAEYLLKTYAYWFSYMVDHKDHEIWHWVKADNRPNMRIPKQHSWKNGLHSFEHALVGYIICQQIHNKPVTLYFAFAKRPPQDEIQPYLFQGKVQSVESTSTGDKVVFTSVR
jgi:mannose/cellobiose epimerase-like protein (N-acyl-D-glucosamine 2-epimerase family)